MTISQSDDIIQTDDGDRPQLVHRQKHIGKASLLIRLATHLGLTKGDKPMTDAVEKAYAFVSGHYRQGDQVTLLIWSYHPRDLDAAEMLAKYLRNGTPPSDLSRVQSKNVGNVSSGRIPIHCVAVFGLGEKSGILPVFGERSSVIEWNDKLRSRSPPGIKHITCWDYGIEFRNCTTRWDADGSMISREICNSGDGGGYELLQ
ncbi:hypothetical protein V565_186180, partial [Rhizoctonia solani 123E]